MLDPEAVAQRRGQQARAGGGADEREGRQVEGHDPRPRALADRDRQPAVLHGRVEGLLQGAVEAVDLVDEEHGPRLERAQQRRDVALALERRAGGLHEGHLELRGDDLRQRRLAQAGRTGEQHVVERLAAGGRRLDRDLQLLAQAVLADELVEGARAQRAVELVLAVQGSRGVDALEASSRSTPRSALASSSSAVSPSAAASSACASAGWKPSSSSPSRATWRGSSPRVTVIGSSSSLGDADLLAQLDRRSARPCACRCRARPAGGRRRRRPARRRARAGCRR